MVKCPICARTVCHRCGHMEYGRIFCSRDCSLYFFHGDGEEGEAEG
jgi:endogenous inhibitor of DNA gyrase (YacG/DUF329 family)